MKSRQDFATEQEWLEYYRHYAAAMALQGLLANPNESMRPFWESKVPELAKCKNAAEFISVCAVMTADLLITQLNKPTTNGK